MPRSTIIPRRARRHSLAADRISMVQRIFDDNEADDDTMMGAEMLVRCYECLTGKQSLSRQQNPWSYPASSGNASSLL